MNIILSNFKVVIGAVYLAIISIGLYFLFSVVDFKDLMSYDFIRSNKDIILKFKDQKFYLLSFAFFVFSIVWVLLLGFASPLLVFAGFVFGKWWGISLTLLATTIGATLLYMLAGLFFREMVEEKLVPKFSKVRNFLNKNDIVYFTLFRIAGGGGMPYAIQNLLPILFNMPLRNYFIATFIGSAPSMFVTVSLGSGIESVIDKNEKISLFSVLSSSEIYLPIAGFFAILIAAFFIKKFYLKNR